MLCDIEQGIAIAKTVIENVLMRGIVELPPTSLLLLIEYSVGACPFWMRGSLLKLIASILLEAREGPIQNTRANIEFLKKNPIVSNQADSETSCLQFLEHACCTRKVMSRVFCAMIFIIMYLVTVLCYMYLR